MGRKKQEFPEWQMYAAAWDPFQEPDDQASNTIDSQQACEP